MPGRGMSLEDKPIGSVEVKVTDLLGSDPIGERTALNAMHHYLLVHEDFESSPVTEIRPPSLGCFFIAGSSRIVIGELRGVAD